MPALTGFADFNPDKEIPSLEGKVILITGGTAGIGKISVEALAKHKPAHLYFTGRNESAANDIIGQIKTEHPDVSISFFQLDLTSLAAVKAAVAKFTHDRLDILICNAGVFDVPPALTKDGFEINMGVNHLGHAMLVSQLLPVLERTAEIPGSDVRIVTVTSMAFGFHPPPGIFWDKVKTAQSGFLEAGTRYPQSKLANLVYSTELARRYPQIQTVSVNPGFVATDMTTKNATWITRWILYFLYTVRDMGPITPQEGSLNQLWAAAGVERSKLINGQYYEPVGVPGTLTELAKSKEFADKVWNWTCEVLDSV